MWRWNLIVIAFQGVATMATLAVVTWYAPARGVLAAVHRSLPVQASEPWLAASAAAAAGMVLTALIALPIMYRVLCRWTRGLHGLHEAIRRLSSGATPEPARITGAGEIDYLLASFNNMAAQLLAGRRALVEANETLEQRVAERTRQLEQATLRAEHASAAKSVFLATMSHEIRTPLNGVIGSLDLLQRQVVDARQAQVVRMGRLAADALMNLINDILDFSAIEAGQCELAVRPFDLQTVIDEAIAIVAPPAHQKRLEITCRVGHDVPATVRGDPDRVRQVLINLLNNAIKFTDAGGVCVRAAREASDPRFLRFDVIDTGIGIPAESLQRIFGRFSQGGNDAAHHRGGTGLGLAICRHLVQLMGGDIGVLSVVGEGSTFRFTAELEPVGTAADACVADACGGSALVLEACGDVAAMITHYLAPLRYDVAVVGRTDEFGGALDAAAASRHDLLLLGRGTSREHIVQALQRRGRGALVVVLAHPEDETDLVDRRALPADVAVLYRPLLAGELVRLLRDRAAPSPAHAPAAIGPSPAVCPSATVLLVEDNPINRFINAQLLETLGARVHAVDSGEAAIAAVHAQRYDLVLMDCFMPGLDGFATTRRIRDAEAAGQLERRLPIVALTANVMYTDAAVCREAGMDGCLAKPVDLNTLRDVILGHAGEQGGRRGPAGSDDIHTSAEEPVRMDVIREICREDPVRVSALLGLIDERFRAFRAELRAVRSDTSDVRVRAMAHSVAGSALQCGARSLAEAARVLETAAAHGRATAVHNVLHHIDRCIDYLEAV